jgi:hypothetical protein
VLVGMGIARPSDGGVRTARSTDDAVLNARVRLVRDRPESSHSGDAATTFKGPNCTQRRSYRRRQRSRREQNAKEGVCRYGLNGPNQAAPIEDRLQNSYLRPMLATFIDSPFDDKDWVFETKWDGVRLVAKAGDKDASLHSRKRQQCNGNVTARYAGVAEALRSIDHRAVINGELVPSTPAGARDCSCCRMFCEAKPVFATIPENA